MDARHHRIGRLAEQLVLGEDQDSKLQASGYDILPPTTAIIGYAIRLRNLLSNWHFFVFWAFFLFLFFCWSSKGAKFVTTQTTQIISGGVSLITADNTHCGTTKAQIVRIERELFLFFSLSLSLGGCSRCSPPVRASMLCCFYRLDTQTFPKYYAGR